MDRRRFVLIKKYSTWIIFMFCLIFTGCGNGSMGENSSLDTETVKDSDSYPVFDFQKKTVMLNSGCEMPVLGLEMFPYRMMRQKILLTRR